MDYDIYVDDNTGRFYKWNGSKFVEYKPAQNVEIGSHGDEDITNAEEKARQDKISKEDQADPDRNKGDKSDEVRMQEIKDMMSDPKTGDKMTYDKVKVSQAERNRQKEIARKNADMYGHSDGNLQTFEMDFSKFLANEMARVQVSTWTRPNRRYVTTPFIMKGHKKIDNPHIPSIRIYFDQSASWSTAMIADGKKVIESIVNKYVKTGKLVVEVLYFAERVSENPRNTGSGTHGEPIIENIRQYQPDNVIIMTDSDINDLKSITVIPGGVFLLFKNSISPNLQQNLRGRAITRSYLI